MYRQKVAASELESNPIRNGSTDENLMLGSDSVWCCGFLSQISEQYTQMMFDWLCPFRANQSVNGILYWMHYNKVEVNSVRYVIPVLFAKRIKMHLRLTKLSV